MSLESNTGTQYYAISCVVPDDSLLVLLDENGDKIVTENSYGILIYPHNIDSNLGTLYHYLSSNYFILWGQSTHYTPVTSNKGTQYYFYECNVASDLPFNVALLSATASLSALPLSATQAKVQQNLLTNTGTTYYYNSAFNCVTFCD